jgi:hypothetical protein
MSVPSISAASSLATAAAAPAPAAVRAADGDYKAANVRTNQTKDSDGDYKSLAASVSAAAQTSNKVQATLSSIKVGG